VRWPCFYGIDFPTRAELIANGMDTDGVRRSIGADSLGYVSLDGLITATEQPKTRLCRACFDGEYPIELPAGHLIGKHLLEAKPTVPRPPEEPSREQRSPGPFPATPRTHATATASPAGRTPRGET
jgi:amidophosphoribosyltransferase